VISHQLERLLPDGRGRRFFAGGPEDGLRWRLFCEKLEERDGPVQPVEAGARHAFARFAVLMESWPQPVRQAAAVRA
jgi:heme oxygenase